MSARGDKDAGLIAQPMTHTDDPSACPACPACELRRRRILRWANRVVDLRSRISTEHVAIMRDHPKRTETSK